MQKAFLEMKKHSDARLARAKANGLKGAPGPVFLNGMHSETGQSKQQLCRVKMKGKHLENDIGAL